MAETIGLRAVIDMSKFNKGLGQYTKGVALMNKRTKVATKGMSGSFAKVETAIGVSLGALGLGAAVAGLVAFGKAAIQEGRAFTQAMSNVAAVSGAVGEDFAKLEAQAKQLGATTKFTGVQAAEGMSFLAMAGFSTTEILSAMPGTLNLAAAANLDLGKSADIVSNVLTGFGATAESTDRFVDVLTNTFTTSNTTLIQLGQAMKNVAPVAASLGFSVEETAAAIGKMGDAGIQGGAAGTQLKNALLKLAAPSAAGAALMKELGIEIFDAAGEMKSLPEIIGAVNEGLADLSPKQRIAAVQTLAGKRAIAGFQVLLNQGQSELATYSQEVGVLGNTSKIAAVQLDNLEGDITLLNSAFSGFKLDAFELMEPTLRGASKELTSFLTSLSKGAQAWKQIFQDQIPVIEQWREAHKQAAQELQSTIPISGRFGVSINTNTKAFEDATQAAFDLASSQVKLALTAEDVTEANIAYIRSATDNVQVIRNQLGDTIDLTQATSDLTLAESDTTQQSIELNRIQNATLPLYDELARAIHQAQQETAAYEQSQIDAAAAEEARQQTAISLLGTMGDFFSGLQGAREKGLEDERQFNASITNIRTGAAEAQEKARDSANKKLVSLEEKRAAEEHRILTGGMSRSAEATEAFVQANNAHFQELKDAEIASLNERQAAVEADFVARESQAQAARAKELAEQQAHLEELKLNAALATLESVGQLQQFTGGLAISANEAAELIRSGVLPVTEELGAAIGTVFSDLQQQEGAVTAQVASNQAILQEAFAGTLEPVKNLQDIFGTGIPEAAAAAQAATGLANADIIAGAQNAALASQEQDLALQNLGTTTFPTLGVAAQTATQTMNDAFTTAATPISEIDLTLNNMATITLPLLSETFLIITTAIIEQLLLLLTTGIMPVDLALVTMTTVTLPILQSTSDIVTLAMVAGFTTVNSILLITIEFLGQIVLKLGEVTTAAEKTVEALSKIGDENEVFEDMIELLDEATSFANDLASALSDVASAQTNVGGALAGIGFSGGAGMAQGMGFQAGTPANTNGALGLGFRIPGTGFGDTFGPMFAEPGEEMLVTPRGTSIEGLVFSRLAALLRGTSVQGGGVTNNITNIEMNMNLQTTSSARANVQQFEIQRGLLGV